MAGHGFGVQRVGRERTAPRLLAALSGAVLLVGLLGPATAAAAAPRGHFGNLVAIQKHVGAPIHTGSMAAVAAAETLRPHLGTARTLHLPGLAVPSHHAAKLTPTVEAGRSRAPGAAPLIISPTPIVTTSFAGMTEPEAGGEFPADPWVAVNSSYVVQVVNDMVRVTNRAGGFIAEVPNEAFFQIEPGHFAADPRILWDAAHGRWVGEVAFFTNDLSDDGLMLAVSDGADPTAGWTIRPTFFGAFLPDFPSIASSNDKITIVDNIYDSTPTFLGADFNTYRWSEIVGGVVATDHFCDDSAYIHPRAAQVLSSSNDIHLVMVATDGSADQQYWRLTGNGECSDFHDGTDLTLALGFDPLFESGPPPAPRQPGPDTITDATDGRFTDAVWMNNHLYWVSTFPITYDAGATWNDQVIVWNTTTATTSGSPTGFGYAPVRPGDGIDAYLGGIGLTRDGTAIVSWSQSSTTDPIAFYATSIEAIGTPGSIEEPQLLDTSDGELSTERWGDYAAVATDPTGAGSVWVTHMLAAEDGSWRTRIARMIADNTGPTTPGTPTASPVTATTLGVLPKFRISWAGSTDAGSGSVVYRLFQNVDGAGFLPAGTVAATSIVRSLSPSHTYQFRLMAIDPLNNGSGFATGPVLHISVPQSPTSKTGTWHTASGSGYVGGSTWYATAAGASATYSTTSVRAFAIVGTRATSRGSFKVYVDGVFKATVTETASATVNQAVLYQVTFASPGTHSIKIVVSGTAGHPRVDVDAFLVLK
jgi:hypothetical protein